MNIPYQRAEEIYGLTVEGIKMMLGDVSSEQGAVAFNVDFSVKKLSLVVVDAHRAIIEGLIEVLDTPVAPMQQHFEARWLLLNKLLLLKFHPSVVRDSQIIESSPSLAALVAFPLLEELARLSSGAWDEDGKVLRDIDKHVGLTRIDSKGKRVPHSYKAGDTIVNLAHKLFLMEAAQSEALQITLRSLSERMSAPIVQGGPQTAPLYEKLQAHRDLWAHGREFSGWEGLFVNLLISLVYFARHMTAYAEH